ncbi:MAG TPA: dTDP-4-dehydrorhamnose 3,5-epimerase family protein [Bauldia sp.]|nr:dTDP-4-dehydrorhamnose 3,5-epimerase family protein [Bauldia sp.]
MNGPIDSVTAAGAIPAVIGGEELVAKHSAVTAAGALKAELIHDVVFRPTRPVPHEDGHVAEVARAAWPEVGGPVVQVHTTTTFPGRIRAWGLHQRSTDRLFVVSGLVRIVVFDGRLDSPTKGRINEFTVSEKNPGLLVIPPNLYHGWKNIGTSEAIIINMPSVMYNHEAPDALDLPYESEAAPRIVPYRF